MPLTVEDGTAKSDAQTYVSEADCATYLDALGQTTFSGLNAANQSAALLRAMRWLEARYRSRWKGHRVKVDQALAWPRYGVTDQDSYLIEHDTIPQPLKDALCEAAHREAVSAGSLAPDLERGGAEASKTEKVGPIERTTSWRSDAPNTKTFPQIEQMLKVYVTGSMFAKLVRN